LVDGSQFLRELIAIVDLHVLWIGRHCRLLCHVAESERFGVLPETLAALAVEDVLKPLLKVLLSEG
jgi:hypothetical protein